MNNPLFAATVAVLSIAAIAGAAHAGGISSTLSATYYEVADAARDPDFNSGDFPTVANGSSLGPDGLPVASGGVHDRNGAGEITWWSPAFDAKVTQTGTGTITLPYASNMYPPDSRGGNDRTDFETAKFTGVFSLAGPGTVTFTLGSDDDTFLYVDGKLVVQNPGVHAVSTATNTSGPLSAGSHTLTLFYADRENVGAYLSINSSASISAATPEPAAWTLMVVGFGSVGAALRRRKAALAV